MSCNVNTVECPVCRSFITYDVYGLLAGKKYSCPGCSLVMSLSGESHEIVEKAMNKLETLKKTNEGRK